NRRKQIRVEGCLEAHWDATCNFSAARITDLSEGGCYIDSIGEVFDGEPISLEIKLQGDSILCLPGVVAHHIPRLGFGVRFVDFSEEQLSQIRALMSEMAQPGKPNNISFTPRSAEHGPIGEEYWTIWPLITSLP